MGSKMNNTKKIVAISMLSLSSIASAASYTFSGNIVNHNDVIKVNFSLAGAASNVRVWTDSFLANASNPSGTNFDPITALWNADTGTRLGQNDDNATISPSTQTKFDSGFLLPTLAAGNYIFTMAAYNNFSNSGFLSGGFNFDSQAPIAIGSFDQPANEENKRGSFWRINLDGVDAAIDPNTTPSAVPVPGALWLFATAIAGFAGFGRRKIM